MMRGPKSVIIADLDGTLCDVTHRLHHAQAREWEQFHLLGRHSAALPATDVLRHLESLYRVVYITGRPMTYFAQTIAWIAEQFLPAGPLLMRTEGDRRPDAVIKLELASIGGYTPRKVLFVLDDRERMVDAWRAAGYLCLQPERGAY